MLPVRSLIQKLGITRDDQTAAVKRDDAVEDKIYQHVCASQE
jgi:hypothetical protein